MSTLIRSTTDLFIRLGLAALALTNAYIHSTLGGPMFTLNAVGFAVLAVALVAPVGIARDLRWLTRIALAGYAATTAIGWLLFGARYDVGYLSFGLDLAIVAIATLDSVLADGSPVSVARRLIRFGTFHLPPPAGV